MDAQKLAEWRLKDENVDDLVAITKQTDDMRNTTIIEYGSAAIRRIGIALKSNDTDAICRLFNEAISRATLVGSLVQERSANLDEYYKQQAVVHRLAQACLLAIDESVAIAKATDDPEVAARFSVIPQTFASLHVQLMRGDK